MKKLITIWYFIFWVIIASVTFFWARNRMVMYWDGIEYDEQILRENCDVTPEEYIERTSGNSDFCPEGEEAEVMIGGMERDWESIIASVVIVSIVYNIVYFIYALFIKRI